MKIWALAAVLLIPACSNTAVQPRDKAVQWLWSQQQADGGWHSGKYGLLRSGQSLTPFVLNTLLEADRNPPAGKVDKAIAFIRANTAADGSPAG